MPEKLSRRDAILEAVVQLVDTEGADSLTIRRVADEVGVSTGLVLYYFKTKRDLLAASWQLAVERYGRQIQEAAGDTRGLERLQAHFRGCFHDPDERLTPWSFWLQYWATVARDDEIRSFNLRNYKVMRQKMADDVSDGISSGAMRSDIDPLLISDMLKTIDYGLTVQLALDHEVISSERAVEIAALALSLLED